MSDAQNTLPASTIKRMGEIHSWLVDHDVVPPAKWIPGTPVYAHVEGATQRFADFPVTTRLELYAMLSGLPSGMGCFSLGDSQGYDFLKESHRLTSDPLAREMHVQALAWLDDILVASPPTSLTYGSVEWGEYMTGVHTFTTDPLEFALAGANREMRRKRALNSPHDLVHPFFAENAGRFQGTPQPEGVYDLTLWLYAQREVLDLEDQADLFVHVSKASRILLIRQPVEIQRHFYQVLMRFDEKHNPNRRPLR